MLKKWEQDYIAEYNDICQRRDPVIQINGERTGCLDDALCIFACNTSDLIFLDIPVLILPGSVLKAMAALIESAKCLIWNVSNQWGVYMMPWRRHQMETFSALLAHSPVTGVTPHKGQWGRVLMFLEWKKKPLYRGALTDKAVLCVLVFFLFYHILQGWQWNKDRTETIRRNTHCWFQTYRGYQISASICTDDNISYMPAALWK